jgi:hypothetical protein
MIIRSFFSKIIAKTYLPTMATITKMYCINNCQKMKETSPANAKIMAETRVKNIPANITFLKPTFSSWKALWKET